MTPEVISSLLDFGQLSGFLLALYFFLQHLQGRDEDLKIKDEQQIEAHKICEQSIKQMAQENKDLTEKCLIAFDKNTNILARVEKCLEETGS